MTKKRKANKGFKRRGNSQAAFLKKMKAIPLPQGSVSLHGRLYQESAVVRLLDKELLGGVINPNPLLRNTCHAKIADISGMNLDALDDGLAQA